MLRHVALSLVVCLVACDSTTRPTEEIGPTNFQLLRGDFSAVENLYPGHGGEMVAICCPNRVELRKEPREVEAACRELQRVIETSSAPFGAFENWGPRCFQRIAPSSLLLAARNMESFPSALRPLLMEAEPTNEFADALFAQRLGESADVDKYMVTQVLAGMPDRELAQISKRLDSDDPRIVSTALDVLRSATEHPVEIPGLLDRLRSHSSERAKDVARDYESLSRADPDQHLLSRFSIRPTTTSIVDERASALAGMISRSDWKRQVRLALSRRSAFCTSRIASMILAAFRADGDPTDSYLAERAIQLRHDRCGARLKPDRYAQDLPRPRSE